MRGMKRKLLYSLIGMFLISPILISCDNNQKTAKIIPSTVKKYTQPTTLEGVVSNNKGIVKSGRIKVTDESGRPIVHATIENGHFTIDVPANTELPILLTASTDSDTGQWIVAVIDDKISNYQINPATTAIAKAAKAMGGYTRPNMVRAAEETVHVPDANKTTSGWRGDPTTQYGGWH